MSDTITITPEKRKMFREDATFVLAHEKKNLERVGAAEAILLLLNALEQAEARAENAEAKVARLTKERDWLADKAADICASVYQESFDMHWWNPADWKEAARRAVAAGEG